MSDSDFPLPPPNFEFLVLSLKMQAEMRLGLMPGMGIEDSEDNGVDLRGARHAIDMIAMIAEKTRGNLSMEEGRLIENSLTELRFRFVQTSEAVQKAASEKEKSAKEKIASGATSSEKPAEENAAPPAADPSAATS